MTKNSRKDQRRRAAKARTYTLLARGWSVEVTTHRLSKRQSDKLKKWGQKEGGETESLGNAEDILSGYNCYDTNLWQSGVVPVAGSSGLLMLDDNQKEIFSIPELTRGVKTVREKAGDFFIKSNKGDVLVYFEESKGAGAAWVLESCNPPRKQDFVVQLSEINIGGDATAYVYGVLYKGEVLERDYDQEDLVGKAAYSTLL